MVALTVCRKLIYLVRLLGNRVSDVPVAPRRNTIAVCVLSSSRSVRQLNLKHDPKGTPSNLSPRYRAQALFVGLPTKALTFIVVEIDTCVM